MKKLIEQDQNTGCNIYLDTNGKYSVYCVEFGDKFFETLSQARAYCDALYTSYN